MAERPLRLLALDAALGGCSACVWAGAVVAERIEAAGRGQQHALAPIAEAVLREAAVSPATLDAVAVGIGPGSFTGLRAALSLAHGLARAAGVALVGVTAAEALAAALPGLHARTLWVAIDSRRGRVFLDRADGAGFVAVALEALPRPTGAVAVAGDAAVAVAARLAAAGVDTMLTDARVPLARYVARAAAARIGRGMASGPVLPLYVDPPEARLPAAGLRPAPAGSP